MTRRLAKIEQLVRHNEIAKTALVLALVIGAEYLLFFGLRSAFGTEYLPFHPVSSESMLPTLKVGDLIIVRGIDPKTVQVNQIIVFHNPRSHDMLIVHRVVGVVEKDGVLYFETKGDNNPGRDNWSPYPGVPQGLLVGTVIGTVPYVGYVILALKEPIGIIGVATLTVLVIVYEFVLPLAKKTTASQTASLAPRREEQRETPES